MSYTLTLPYPVSSNRYYRRVRHMMILSKEAKEFKAQVLQITKDACVGDPILGRVSVHIDMYPKRPKDWAKRARVDPLYWDNNVTRIDLDNARKAIYDSLKNIVFEDDKLVFTDSGDILTPDGEARVVVRIRSKGDVKGAIDDLAERIARLDPGMTVVSKASLPVWTTVL